MTPTTKSIVSDLEIIIEHHNDLYWKQDRPEISDEEYDKLVLRLKERAPDSPVLNELTPESTYGQDVVHEIPMLSMDKAYSVQEVQKWAKGTGGKLFVASAKLDGCSCSLVYENGILVQASTRGKGTVGEDCTENAKTIQNIPKTISFKDRLEVRGEVIMPLSVFEDFKDESSNPRNLTAGSLKQKDPKETAERRLIFLAHNVLYSDLESEARKFEFLYNQGFQIVPCTVDVPSADFEIVYNSFLANREEYDFEIDGVIFTVENVFIQERLGFTSHHPKFSIAWKIAGEFGTTVLRDIKWQIARTGVVTPVAEVDPVLLSGASVTRATIHHAGFIRSMGLSKGAVVEMSRRGMVIPQIERVVTPGTEPFEIPSEVDGEKVFLDGDFLRLVNPNESNLVMIGRMRHLVRVLEIEELGEKTLTQLFDSGTISSPEDVFSLTKESIMAGMERSGERSAEKIMANIDAKRQIPLNLFLQSLGIAELGNKVSEVLVDKYKDLSQILSLTEAELMEIEGIGPSISQAVVSGLRDSRAFIESYLGKNITVVVPKEKETIMGALNGKSFLFTGTLESMGRKEAQAIVSVKGGINASSVNKDLDFLVLGGEERGSSKQVKAEKLSSQGFKIRIISEDEFFQMTEG
jgi:DNA ligase (NAD+)